MAFQRAAGPVRDSKVCGVNVLPEQPAEGFLCKLGRINCVISLGIPVLPLMLNERLFFSILIIRE